MSYFPTLSVSPELPIRMSYKENAVIAQFDGYVQTRPRFTRIIRTFSFTYRLLPQSDLSQLTDFIEQVGIFQAFNWTHPKTGETFVVRFARMPTIELVVGPTPYYDVSIELEEV